MDEQSRESIRVSITVYKDANTDVYALLNQTIHNRPEVLRRLIDYAINQFSEKSLTVQNILNGSFYYSCNSKNGNKSMETTSNNNELIDEKKVSKIASNINF